MRISIGILFSCIFLLNVGRIRVEVEEWDDDGGWSNNDFIHTYKWYITWNYASSSWSTSRKSRKNGYFEIKYRFQCDTDYYGSLCTTYCKARNDYYGHYTCLSTGAKQCLSGWTGTYCTYDVNECTAGLDTCHSVTEYCKNVGSGGGYTCECATGYQKSGSSCVNINECSSSSGGCSHYCYDSQGSFTCGCRTGYYLSSSGKYCYDTNECSTDNGGCDHRCYDTTGSFYCRCNTGYVLSSNGKTCYDTNECSVNTDGCHHYCQNTAGSYYCDCYDGYRLSSSGKTCDEINECTENTDNCAQNCLNTAGSYTCSCNSGFTLSSGRYCNDVNECSNGNGGCAHTCTNTHGSFTCSCNTGYYLSSNSRSCLDTNECGTNNGGCSHICTNTAGSFACSCRSGYYLSSNKRSCYDINECTQTHGCDHSCLNSAGSYSCQCSTGYILGLDQKSCQDINECSQVPRICSQQCTDTMGSYTCACITGYRLDTDEKTCNDIDECAEDATLCPSPKTCVNQPGSYKCDCLSGYQLLQNPERCVDINECSTGTNVCEQTCTNLIGSYECGCNTNYYLSNTYSCDIITFTVAIASFDVTSIDAKLYLSILFSPSTSRVSVTNQVHTLDVSFGNGNYEVTSPTSSYYPITNSNLKPYRYYSFYITTSGVLYSADSIYYTIRTLESYPSAPPENIRVTDITSNSIRIEWAAPPSPDRNGILTGYTIDYKMTEDTLYTTVIETLTEITLTNLNEFTEYQVRISASTSVGLGPYSNLMNITTNEGVPISPPEIEVTYVGAKSINLTLTPPSADNTNGIITQYQVAYYAQVLDQLRSIEILPDAIWTSPVELTLAQLEENVAYQIKARIWTKIGSGPYSGEVIYKTMSAPPSGAAQNITFFSVQSTSLVIHWYSPPDRDLNSDSISYRVQYFGNNFDTNIRTETTSETEIMLTGLQEWEVYTVSICSYNNLGNGPCEVVEIRTLESAPSGHPRSVTAIALHDTALKIFWNSVEESETNGLILEYEVRVNGTHHDNHSYLYSTNLTIITITGLEEYELYSVEVRAVNSLGVGPYSNVVEVRTHQDVPAGSPRELEGTPNITSILLTWVTPLAVDINGEITSYEVHYVGTFKDMLNRTASSNNTVYTLYQLYVDETYMIQVRAYTSIGPGPYSSWIAIRTLEDAPSDPPQGVTTIAHSSTEIEVVWMPPVKRGQNGIIVGYEVYISGLSSNYSRIFYVSGGINVFMFTSLKPYHEYSISIAAVTEAGVGPFSSPIVERCLQDIPGAAPTLLMLNNITSRTVSISWTPVSNVAINGVLIHYELEISSFESIIKIEPGLTSYSVYGLSPNTEYSIRIAAETSPGTGPYTPLLNFTTSEEAPSVGPTIDSVNSITSTTFVVTWSLTPDTSRNGDITGYEISVTESLTNLQVYDKISAASDTMILVTELNEYTRYRVSVIAINNAGSSPSTLISIETAQSRPTSPPQYIHSIVNTTCIELSWFSPIESNQNGIITGYEIQVNQIIYFTNSTHYILKKLEEAFHYVIQIRAITIVGVGPFSTAINLATLPASPSAPPQDVNVSSISSDKILVNWNPISYLEQNGHILQYIVYYWQSNASNATHDMFSTDNSTQISIPSLKPYTYYSIYVLARNIIGASPHSKTVTIRTMESIPNAAPGNFTVHIISPTSVRLTWNQIPSYSKNGVIIHQTITYFASEILTEEQNININSEWTNFTMTNFHPSITYQFSIHASTSIGNGPRSYVNITMPESNPSAAPDNVMISNVLTGFHVEWNELSIEDRNGEISLYHALLTFISNGTEQGTIQIFNSTIPEMNITNLTPSTRYTIQVRAMTSAGPGPYSETLEALTAPDGLECFGYFSLYQKEPCSNGAVCKQKEVHEFSCDCVAGYEGVLCENEIDECQTNYCESGECVDLLNNFTCNCFVGYTGRLCEVEINECLSEPCLNGGACIDHVDDYECICTDEYLGPVCEYFNQCLENPCQHGSCTPNLDNYDCKCETGFAGENCQYNINDCEDVICGNGGECLDGISKFDCTCYYGYKGRYCQYPRSELTCESEKISRINWPATEYSQTAIMPCQYIDPSFMEGNASRVCSIAGVWEEANLDDCIRNPFEILSTHLHDYNDIFGDSTQINSNNISAVVQNTAFIVCGRSILSPEEIELTLNLTTYALNSILNLDFVTKRSLIASLNDRFLCIFSTLVSIQNIEFFTQEYQNMTNNLFNALELFSNLNAKTSNSSCISITSDNILLLVREIDITLNSSDFNLISNCEQTNSTIIEDNMLSFPSSLTNALLDSNSKLGVSVMYSNNLGRILTQISSGFYSDFVPASTLVMVELATDIPNQLRNPIHINFALLDTQSSYYNTHCVYWDTALYGWSSIGLDVYDITNDSVTCSSAHLSTFMVLTEPITAVNPIDVILNYIVYGISGIAVMCLLLSIILLTFLGRELLESDIYIAQFSLCVSILLFLISHVIGILNYSLIQEHCNIIAMVVYFCSLSSTTCFLADGAAICFKFVLPKMKRRIHIILLILGWIVPIPLTVFRVVFDSDNLGVKDQHCWLSKEISIIWSMIEPILVIFFITFIVLIISLIRCCVYRNIELVRVAKFSLSSHFLLAPFMIAPWVVTLVNIYIPVPYYRWVCTSFIAVLGFLFFMLYAVRNNSIRSKFSRSKVRSKKISEMVDRAVINADPPSHLLEYGDIPHVLAYNNPIYDETNEIKDSMEGATPNLKEKMLDEFPEKGESYHNPVCENIYSEVTQLRSNSTNPFESERLSSSLSALDRGSVTNNVTSLHKKLVASTVRL
ncbi:EGF-like domain-containing protein [Oopsacas minuta]|uniref:EGF-like domain-containing protein n=1 Tax=Oopsacas minuta TaxID=111878 RepID=A0AAV7JYB4_9METZ|nr:EGF-like domain-containing protein [Oopsacas minuta]